MSVQLKKTIASRLRYLRGQSGRYQHEIASAISVTRKAYQSYEEARALPPITVIIAIKNLYCLDHIDDIIGDGEGKVTIETAYMSAPDNLKKAINCLLNIDTK